MSGNEIGWLRNSENGSFLFFDDLDPLLAVERWTILDSRLRQFWGIRHWIILSIQHWAPVNSKLDIPCRADSCRLVITDGICRNCQLDENVWTLPICLYTCLDLTVTVFDSLSRFHWCTTDTKQICFCSARPHPPQKVWHLAGNHRIMVKPNVVPNRQMKHTINNKGQNPQSLKLVCTTICAAQLLYRQAHLWLSALTFPARPVQILNAKFIEHLEFSLKWVHEAPNSLMANTYASGSFLRKLLALKGHQSDHLTPTRHDSQQQGGLVPLRARSWRARLVRPGLPGPCRANKKIRVMPYHNHSVPCFVNCGIMILVPDLVPGFVSCSKLCVSCRVLSFVSICSVPCCVITPPVQLSVPCPGHPEQTVRAMSIAGEMYSQTSAIIRKWRARGAQMNASNMIPTIKVSWPPWTKQLAQRNYG